ncbi:serine aminopeptidase S33 family [Homoserinimonas aerilata]|uniref:Serine aminopeptidase S33 family n=1 Tax=Homoserinimonas aerilata TaxID=1162970 RepID=A0A542YLB1_9MICO|nr:alpha/beta hydrolase [Homoserinimonas aerilata]TQL48858.1 serine aminopeptidase S33 family [Homoserinimonas aerilata]
MRAHGKSTLIGAPADFTLDNLAAEAITGRSGPLTVIGISMGSAIALRIALNGLANVERLILIRPAFTTEPVPANLVGLLVAGQLLHDHPAARAEELFRRTRAFRDVDAVSPAGAENLLVQFRKPQARERAIRLIEIPRNRAYSTGETTQLAMPTTIIATPRDPVHPVRIAEQWHAAIPSSILTLAPARDDGLAAQTDAIRAAIAAGLG